MREATEFFSRKKLVIQIHIQEQILSQTDLDVPFMRMRTDSGKPLILEEVGTKRTSNPRGLQAGHAKGREVSSETESIKDRGGSMRDTHPVQVALA